MRMFLVVLCVIGLVLGCVNGVKPNNPKPVQKIKKITLSTQKSSIKTNAPKAIIVHSPKGQELFGKPVKLTNQIHSVTNVVTSTNLVTIKSPTPIKKKSKWKLFAYYFTAGLASLWVLDYLEYISIKGYFLLAMKKVKKLHRYLLKQQHPLA